MSGSSIKLTREQRFLEIIKEICSENLIGDDCAALPSGQIFSSDMLIEGKHFLLPQMSYQDLGWKSMAVNLSDIAAMAGIPRYALVNIGLPGSISDNEFSELYEALHGCASEFGARIIGGDLCASEQLVISVTVIGDAPDSGAMYRSGAQADDYILVTGDFGASALGLEEILKGEKADASHSYALHRHLRPQPKIKEAAWLASVCSSAGALMDCSDGLADALIQVAALSNVGIEIDADAIPVAESVKERAAKLGLDYLQLALYGGEDYELLAAVNPECWKKLKLLPDFKTIGRVKNGSAVVLKRAIDGTAELLESSKTFQHWKS
ncbi:MAG: thiamine-phosphate kinase [Candidatus Obscuribacterales bacterium]|nr:thiamine-phosphate kinase [Candidatus Obscuribacterales bacterium]